MSKFLQLADDIESDLRELDTDAEELNSRRLANKERARQVVNDHHRIQDRIADGLKRMEEIGNLGGSNDRKFTAAELAAIAAAEAEEAKRINLTASNDRKPGDETTTEEAAPGEVKLGEVSGDTSEASFPTGGERG